MSEFLGLDLSRFNNVVNYDLICKEFDFVILRAGGSDDGNPPVKFYNDRYFNTYYNEFRKRGIAIGAYWVVGHRFTNEADGVINAQKFCECLRGKHFDMPLYLDYEVPTPAMKHDGTTAAIAFCRQMEKHRYYTGIYASDISGFKDRLELDRLTLFDKWVAKYGGGAPNYVPKYGMWQYTSKGHVDGVSGNVDINIAYLDYPKLIKGLGLNHLNEKR